MKKLVVLSMAGMLAACQQQPAPEPAKSEAPAEAAPAMVTANGSAPGLYNSVSANGTKGSTMINGDGTYKNMDATGKVTEEGTWAVKDGKSCFSPTTAGAQAMCFTESTPGPDGSFTVTSDKGDKQTITPAAPGEPPSDAASAS